MNIYRSICIGKIIALCVFSLLFAGCGNKSDLCVESVQQAREAWNAAGIANYEMQLRYTGWLMSFGTWSIAVSGTTVTSVAYAGAGAVPNPPMTTSTAPTIPSLFDQIEQNCAQSNVTASYNSVYHYPEHAYFDYGQEGDGFDIDAFAPL